MITSELLVKMLRGKQKKSYSLLVKKYFYMIEELGAKVALTEIKGEIEREAGEKIELNYQSLSQAFGRYKKSNGCKTQTKIEDAGERRRYDFKDEYEVAGMKKPGSFKALD